MDTLNKSHVTATSEESAKAASKAEKKKLTHYQELSRNYTVMPIATETMGAWGQMAVKFIQDLGSRIAEATGEERSTSFIFQSIGMAIQRGNAMSVLGTTPNTKDLHEIFSL